MEHIILFDNEIRDRLLPFTYTRPVCELRVGMLTIKEKWEQWMGCKVSYITQDYLAEKFPIERGDTNFVINGSVMPSEQLCTLIRQMGFNEAYLRGEELIVAKLDATQLDKLVNDEDISEIAGFDIQNTSFLKLDHLWDIFGLNDEAIRSDFEVLTRGRRSRLLSRTNQVMGSEQVFVEDGAEVECCILNATTGPIYIGKGAKLLEGSMLRGPVAVMDGAVIKMGSKIYGATTLGPGSKVGGELNNVVFWGNSNKSHDGYLGNSVIGEWCNLGAGTSCSNMKNNYSTVRLWNDALQDYEETDLQFVGLFMGDHVKCGIHTAFNTGTVVGVGAHIFGTELQPKYIPSFAGGGAQRWETHEMGKAFEMMERVMSRKEVRFSAEDRLVVMKIFEDTSLHRSWEK
ncbi:MAG: putative sugar nucleotidyl transferase [Saprospiraceae bacterium]|nr:putative sugar nucleotidyl transferase [Saprospiraceae bacterium]